MIRGSCEALVKVRAPCNFTSRNPSHNPTLENNARSPRVDLSLSLSEALVHA